MDLEHLTSWSTCPSFQHLAEQAPEKVLDASWAALQEGQVFAVDVEIRAQDLVRHYNSRTNLYKDRTVIFASIGFGINW